MITQLAVIDGALLALTSEGKLYRSWNAPHCLDTDKIEWQELPLPKAQSGEIRRAS